VKLIHTRTHMQVTRVFDIIDGPEMLHPGSVASGKKVLLTKVEITYVLNSGLWVVDRWGGGELMIHGEGWALRQDGTRSQRRWSGQVTISPGRAEGAWLKKLIDDARPVGVLESSFDVVEA
jgi:hypothetical protein